jgi:hypothetical protein
MATVAERVSVLETKLDNVKQDITDNHASLVETLKEMRIESTKQHGELAGKVKDLQEIKDKWIKYGMVALAFAAGAGWIHATNIQTVLKLFGL